MNDTQKSTLIHAINHFGVDHQIDKALEEIGELITELSRRRTDRGSREKIALEIADVLITANQLRIIFGAELVDKNIDNQLMRLRSEINSDIDRVKKLNPEVYHRNKTD
jgi:hypothetical protein